MKSITKLLLAAKLLEMVDNRSKLIVSTTFEAILAYEGYNDEQISVIRVNYLDNMDKGTFIDCVTELLHRFLDPCPSTSIKLEL